MASASASMAKVTAPPAPAVSACARPACEPSSGTTRSRSASASSRTSSLTRLSAGRLERPRRELDLDRPVRAASVHLDRHGLARGLEPDQVGQVVGAVDRAPVDLRDHVAARGNALGALEGDLALTGGEAGVGGGAAALDLGPPRAARAAPPQPPRELRVEVLRLNVQVGVADGALGAQLGERALDDVDRHREAHALAAAAGGLDLRVDADHAAPGVEQRPAGVAVV